MKQSTMERVFGFFNLLFMLFIVLVTLYPFINVIAVSLSENKYVNSGMVTFCPMGFNLNAYKYILGMKMIINGYSVTTFIVLVGTTISLVLTALTAYPLARKDLWGRNLILFLIVFTMLFSGGMIPAFLLVKNLGLMNSLWALIIPGAISAYNLIIMKNFFQSIPESLLESARIDGLSEIGILFKIVIPLSTAAIATIGLFYAVGNWNSFFSAVMYINDRSKWPLQLVLRQILFDSISEAKSEADVSRVPLEAIKMAVIVATTLPILLVYPFIQKHFVKGVLIGSVKG